MIPSMLDSIHVITLFVDDISEAKTFYGRVFDAPVVYEDDDSVVLGFSGLMVNLLSTVSAPELVEPATVATASAGASVLLTIEVEDVDATCEALREYGVTLLNGPIDRPWGRRTAAFADPAGHVWEVAQVLD